MSSASASYKNTIMSLSVCVCIYADGVSNVSMSRPPCASTAAVMNTNSVSTVGEAASYLLILSYFFLPTTHARRFMSPFRFDFRTLVLPLPLIIFCLFGCIHWGKVSRNCSFISYFIAAAYPFSLEFLNPVFISYCVMITWSMLQSRFSLIIFSVALFLFRLLCPLLLVLPYRLGINLFTCFLVLVG